ncbi:MAG: autoinducer synthase, partial [Pseudomonadota bacterium]
STPANGFDIQDALNQIEEAVLDSPRLPVMGRTMVNEHFGDLISGPITSPVIWECTRFCLTRGAGSHVAAALMLGGGEIMQNFGIEHFVGVFDARMVRIYRMIGSSPDVLGSAGTGRDQISVGLWHFDGDAAAAVAKRAGVPLERSRQWFDHAFGTTSRRELARTA